MIAWITDRLLVRNCCIFFFKKKQEQPSKSTYALWYSDEDNSCLSLLTIIFTYLSIGQADFCFMDCFFFFIFNQVSKDNSDRNQIRGQKVVKHGCHRVSHSCLLIELGLIWQPHDSLIVIEEFR